MRSICNWSRRNWWRELHGKKITVSVGNRLIQFPRAVTGELPVRIGLLLLSFVSLCANAAESAQLDTDSDLPSAAMLEFLGEIDPVDEATWRLLEHHAQQDLAQKTEVEGK